MADSAAGASPTSPAPTPLPTADPCATAVPDLPNTLRSAFAYEITSAAVLQFLSQIKRVPEREQQRVFDAAVAAARTPRQHELELAEQRVCPTLEEICAQTRALTPVANEWTPRELQDERRRVACGTGATASAPFDIVIAFRARYAIFQNETA
jgi:hypothetical protein